MLIIDFKLLDTVSVFNVSIGWEDTRENISLQEASDAWGNFINEEMGLVYSETRPGRVQFDYATFSSDCDFELTLGYWSQLTDEVDLTLYDNRTDNYIEFFFNNLVDAIAFLNANFVIGVKNFVPQELVIDVDYITNKSTDD